MSKSVCARKLNLMKKAMGNNKSEQTTNSQPSIWLTKTSPTDLLECVFRSVPIAKPGVDYPPSNLHPREAEDEPLQLQTPAVLATVDVASPAARQPIPSARPSTRGFLKDLGEGGGLKGQLGKKVVAATGGWGVQPAGKLDPGGTQK